MLIVSQDKKELIFTDSGILIHVDNKWLQARSLTDGLNVIIGAYESEEEAQLALGYLAGKCSGKTPIAHMPKTGELLKRIAKEEK